MAERNDIFIIWGNGLSHLFEIIDDIRNDGNYDIISIHKYHIKDMETFIRGIYKCDTVPFNHLIAKTKYLLNAPKLCFAIYVKNKNVQEKYYGEGSFRHIQCATIKSTKERIRNKFNPRFGMRRSEEHVIHGTDYADQTNYLKTFFKIKEKEKESYDKLPEKIVPIDSIYCNILGKGVIHISETPHFKFVKGDENEYINYLIKNLGDLLIEDHLPNSFKKLILEFDENKADGIIGYYVGDKLILADGVHRASILIGLLNKKEIKVYIK